MKMIRPRRVAMRFLDFFRRGENIVSAKKKWNELAKKNARYFVLTDKGESISEEEFREAGKTDVVKYFSTDKHIAEILRRNSDTQVLEIGCGIGRLSEFIAPLVGRLHCVDISDEMIRKAKIRLAQTGNVTLYSTDGITYPLPTNSIHIVFSFIVFQHMPDYKTIEQNLKEVARVLKTDGIAKIQLRGVPVSKDKWYYGPSFDKKKVLEILDNASLELVDVDGEGQKYLWVWAKKRDL